MLIKCSDLSIDDKTFGLKRLEGIDQDRLIVVEERSVARKEFYLGSCFEGERSVAIQLHVIKPNVCRQLLDSERHHWFNERKAVCCTLFHRMKSLNFASMPTDPAHQLNRSECQSDFTYSMTVKAIKIQDTGKG